MLTLLGTGIPKQKIELLKMAHDWCGLGLFIGDIYSHYLF